MKNERFIEVANQMKLWVETYGNSENEASLFISGAGANSSFWSERLCNRLVNDGFFVIKYDHRDFGYSSKINFEEHPYDVLQLARDALSIMDSLNVEKAHVVGHSMGGFIAQLLAIHYPKRIRSMISASSSTNSPKVPLPPDKTWEIFMECQPQNNYNKDIDEFLPVWEYLNGTATFDKELAVEYTRNIYARQEITGPLGESHVKAQANLTDRTEALKHVKIPTLVIHGEEDYLVDKYGGIQTAECIENAELVLIPQMGHIPFNQEILLRFENEIIRFINEHR
ncbi:alpha/beta fold hydrolase [Prolixibacter sp. NT017]|uniref:alpha/beta fold hydrolase n=1 Tax=Prolixibacter sp. NT017 TaxID=2652390 RepID=UPI0012771FB7|nr:alpha/beta hydrolase [Prolixibacter sp. NT017]GET25033.1 hydrolase [Prolixibacter sp. NT017]